MAAGPIRSAPDAWWHGTRVTKAHVHASGVASTRSLKKGGVLFRHVGVTVGSWMSVDNSARTSRPEAFVTLRPFRYEPPIFLCPPKK